MQVQSFVFNPFQENTYVVWDEERNSAIIDPGCSNAAENEELNRFVTDHKLKVRRLLNTHCHIDHVLGNRYVKETWNVDLEIPEKEESVLKSAEVIGPAYGFHDYRHQEADKFIKDGDVITVGALEFDVLFVPGHSPGHVAFYNKKEQVLFGGDVLFYNSIGRADLPGGDYDTLIASIHSRLFTLPDDVTVYPGHGPKTTLGYEKKTNPFCAVTTRG